MKSLNLPHIRVGVDQSGHAWVEVEDWELFDNVEDYLIEKHGLIYLWMNTVEATGQPSATTMTFEGSQLGKIKRVLSKLDEREIEKIFQVNNPIDSVVTKKNPKIQDEGIYEDPSGVELVRWIFAGIAAVVGFVAGIFLALAILPILKSAYMLGEIETKESIAGWHRFLDSWLGTIAAGSAAFCVVLFPAVTYPKKMKKVAFVAYLYGILALFGIGIPLALEAEVFTWTEIPAALSIGFLAYKGIAAYSDRRDWKWSLS